MHICIGDREGSCMLFRKNHAIGAEAPSGWVLAGRLARQLAAQRADQGPCRLLRVAVRRPGSPRDGGAERYVASAMGGKGGGGRWAQRVRAAEHEGENGGAAERARPGNRAGDRRAEESNGRAARPRLHRAQAQSAAEQGIGSATSSAMMTASPRGRCHRELTRSEPVRGWRQDAMPMGLPGGGQ